MEALLTGLIISLICAFFTRAVALSKNQSGALGFWLGFFIPVIGLIVMIALPKRSASEIAAARKEAVKKQRAAAKSGSSWYDTY